MSGQGSSAELLVNNVGYKWGSNTHSSPTTSGVQVLAHLSSPPTGGVKTRRGRDVVKMVELRGGASEENCSCNNTRRVRQLEHDLEHMRQVHESTLRGLHVQIDQLKTRNRDLTFQLLMTPVLADSVQQTLPFSPETDDSSVKTDNTVSSVSSLPKSISSNSIENIDPLDDSERYHENEKISAKTNEITSTKASNARRSKTEGKSKLNTKSSGMISKEDRFVNSSQSSTALGNSSETFSQRAVVRGTSGKSIYDEMQNEQTLSLESSELSPKNTPEMETRDPSSGLYFKSPQEQYPKLNTHLENPTDGTHIRSVNTPPPPEQHDDGSAMLAWRARRGRAGHGGDPRLEQQETRSSDDSDVMTGVSNGNNKTRSVGSTTLPPVKTKTDRSRVRNKEWPEVQPSSLNSTLVLPAIANKQEERTIPNNSAPPGELSRNSPSSSSQVVKPINPKTTSKYAEKSVKPEVISPKRSFQFVHKSENTERSGSLTRNSRVSSTTKRFSANVRSNEETTSTRTNTDNIADTRRSPSGPRSISSISSNDSKFSAKGSPKSPRISQRVSTGKSSAGQSSEGQPSAGQSSVGQLSAGQPSAGQSSAGQSPSRKSPARSSKSPLKSPQKLKKNSSGSSILSTKSSETSLSIVEMSTVTNSTGASGYKQATRGGSTATDPSNLENVPDENGEGSMIVETANQNSDSRNGARQKTAGRVDSVGRNTVASSTTGPNTGQKSNGPNAGQKSTVPNAGQKTTGSNAGKSKGKNRNRGNKKNGKAKHKKEDNHGQT